jgi:hypothetical protein
VTLLIINIFLWRVPQFSNPSTASCGAGVNTIGHSINVEPRPLISFFFHTLLLDTFFSQYLKFSSFFGGSSVLCFVDAKRGERRSEYKVAPLVL